MIYNEDILGKVPTNRSVIPEGCLTFAEQSLYVAEFAEENFNTMFESVGIEELAVYESTGSFVLYEGAKLKEFKEKAIQIFKDIFGAIKHAYEKILDFFEKKRKESVKELVKIDSSDVDTMEDGKTYYTTHEFDLSCSEDFTKNAKELTNDIKDQFEKMVNQKYDNIQEQAKELKDDFEQKIVSTISGIENVKTFNEAKKPLYNKMIGKEVGATKSWIKSNLSDLTGVVEKGTTKRDIQTAYQAEKKVIDDIIKGLRSMDDNLIKVANAEISLLKSVTTALHSCMNIKMDVCKRRYNEYRVILTKVATAKKKANHESVSYQEDLVEAAFDW